MWILDHFDKEETRQEVLLVSMTITSLALVLAFLIWAVYDVNTREISANVKTATEKTEQLRLEVRLEELKGER